MSDLSRAQRGAQVNGEGQSPLHIRPLPRISLQAFCETPEFASSVQAAAADRRMSKVHVKVQMGGAPAAAQAYAEASTPNVIAINRSATAKPCWKISIVSPASAIPTRRSSSWVT